MSKTELPGGPRDRNGEFTWHRIIVICGVIALPILYFLSWHYLRSPETLHWVADFATLLAFLDTVGTPGLALWLYIKGRKRRSGMVGRARRAVVKHLGRFSAPNEVTRAVEYVESMLDVRNVVEPVIQPISALPADIQVCYGRGLSVLSGSWIDIVNKVGDECTRKLIAAFFETYAREESDDLLGKAEGHPGAHFVVTNFVAYSRIVTAVIEAARNGLPARAELACFTTLPMPLNRWFNFQGRSDARGSIARRYCEVHDGWEKYTAFLRNLVHGVEPVQLYRCVLAVNDNCRYLQQPDFAFHTETVMRSLTRLKILVPRANRGSASLADRVHLLHPFEGHDLEELFKLQQIGGVLKDTYHNAQKAYVIFPEERVQLPEVRDHTWEKVGEVFAHLYQRPPENCLIDILENVSLESKFLTGNPRNRLPEDMFLVGSKPNDWLLCLASDVGPELNRISLEFITKELNPDRFGLITGYVNGLLSNPRPFHKWVGS